MPATPLEYEVPPKRRRRWLGWFIFIAIVVGLLFMLRQAPASGYDEIPLSEFDRRLVIDQVTNVMISGDQIYGTFDQPYLIGVRNVKSFVTNVPSGAGSSWEMTRWILDHRRNAVVTVQNSNNLVVNIVVPLIPWMLILGFIWFFVFRQLRSARRVPTPVTIVNPSALPTTETP